MAKNSKCKWEEIFQYAKGQIKPYADWRAVDFPKEQTFCFWANIHRANLLMVLSDIYGKTLSMFIS